MRGEHNRGLAMPASSATTLLVDAPPSREPERRYILDVVIGDWLGLDWELRPHERDDVRITVKGDASAADVVLPDVLFSTDERHWLQPASLPRRPLPWRPLGETGADAAERLPVLYGPTPPAATLLWNDGESVRLGVDVFAGAFFMLARYEELVVADRDSHGRFPATSALAHAEGFAHLPIADAYVELLWRALTRRWPRLERKRRRFRLALTHDVDRPLSFLGHGVLGLARQLGADALVRRDARLIGRRVRSWAGIRRGDHRLDPYNTFDFLMSVSERHGIASAFYFLATEDEGPFDARYSVDDPWIRSLMERIHRRGHEIGFHAGFETFRDARRTKAEFDRLRAATAAVGIRQDGWGGRQHFLRWENPSTWSNWEAAGLDYDSTLAFADRVGFRAGTCHEFRAFHLLERRPLRLRERPLGVMEGTLFEYMGLGPDAAARVVVDVERQCRRYAGTLTLLWHNSSLATARERRWYEELIHALASAP
jgi:hypothetical protein